jgi:hypothetical protein
MNHPRTILALLLCLSVLTAHPQSVSSPATFQEKIFVHIDKPFYLAGEVLWCKLYCVDAITHKPLDLSKIAYLELLDKDNRPVLQGKSPLHQGQGEATFYLPPSINTGNYRLRAYTNWMKNFGPGSFFEEPLTIVNTFKGFIIDSPATRPAPSDPQRPTSTRPPAVPYILTFFPEGGDLISNLASNIAFEATDDQGRPISTGGYIVTDKRDTVAFFHTGAEGMGKFTLTPSAANTYTAIFRCPDDITRSQPLPAIRDKGYTIHLREYDTKTLSVTVYASPTLQPGRTRLVSTTGGLTTTSAEPVLSGDSAVFQVDRSKLQDGISRFTLVDESGSPVAERLFFTPPAGILNIMAATDHPGYGLRQKVQLSLSVKDRDGGPRPSRLSVAVYRLDTLQGYPATDITRYLWLSSELKGRLPAIAPTSPDADLLMLTHGWRRFDATVTRQPVTPSNPRFTPELRGQLISGRLTDARSGAALQEVITWISAPGPHFQFTSAQTDNDGRFQIELKNFYGRDGLVIHANTSNDSFKVDIFSPYSEQYTKAPLRPLILTDSQRSLLTRHSIAVQTQNIYTGDSLNRFRLPIVDTLPFYGHPDFTYQLDEFVRFTTMEEVLREYVREINVNKVRGQLHLLMLNEPAKQMFDDGKTLVLLDGIPVPDDRIFAYDPQKVRRLDVIDREYILGPCHFSGIASYITYKGDYEGLALDPLTQLVDYEGTQWHREFYSPKYETPQQTRSRMPDFRNLLYWNPSVTAVDGLAPLEFYTSDMPGNYLVVVQGLSPDGQTGVTYQRFTVHP